MYLSLSWLSGILTIYHTLESSFLLKEMTRMGEARHSIEHILKGRGHCFYLRLNRVEAEPGNTRGSGRAPAWTDQSLWASASGWVSWDGRRLADQMCKA